MAGEIRSDKSDKVFASAMDGAEVTLDDTTANVYNALWIGTAGDGTLRVTTQGGTVLNFVGVPVGFFPVATSIVHSTGTGASNIVGLNW